MDILTVDPPLCGAFSTEPIPSNFSTSRSILYCVGTALPGDSFRKAVLTVPTALDDIDHCLQTKILCFFCY